MDDNPKIAIDVGSSSVKVLVGIAEPERTMILGCGQAFHDGARRGVISSLEQVVGALNTAIEEAEAMSGHPVERAFTALGGTVVWGMSATAGTTIYHRDQKVSSEDIEKVLKRCTEIELPPDIRPMDVVPCRYSLDGQRGLINPLGMIGQNLDAQAFVLFTKTQHADILTHAINQASVEVLAMTHEALAASEAVLSADERELGCLFIDIGHESSEWMVWHENILLTTGTIPIAGRRFTSDLATVLKTTTEGAERIKRITSANIEEEGLEHLGIDVPEMSGEGVKVVSGLEAAHVIYERAQELFTEIARELCRLELEKYLGAGIILTGGCAKLTGLDLVAERVFAQETRIAGPRDLAGETEPVLSPEWAVCCGLLRWASRQEQLRMNGVGKTTGFFNRLRSFIDGTFD